MKDNGEIVDSAEEDVSKNGSVKVMISFPKEFECCICLQPSSDIPGFQVCVWWYFSVRHLGGKWSSN